MSSLRIALLLLFWESLSGCGEPQQYLLYITTDAPMPQLGDRLFLEVRDGTGRPACARCKQLFGLDNDTRWPVSLGFVLPDAASAAQDWHVHARLLAADAIRDGNLGRVSRLESLARLPEQGAGKTRVALVLSAECFGVSAEPGDGKTQARSCDPRSGKLADEPVLAPLGSKEIESLPKPGAWGPGREIPCASDLTSRIPADMVCVPGGAFVLGSPRPQIRGPVDIDTAPERLVRVHRFAIDRDEIRVRDIYRVAPEELAAPYSSRCSYTGTATDREEERPANCISALQAERICARMGKRLPTEAEWEYVAGNLSDESPYPWGESEDLCGHAIVGRSRFPFSLEDAAGSSLCRVSPSGELLEEGLVAGGHPEDVAYRTGVKNLGGNLQELTADQPAGFDGSCWQDPKRNWLDNPRCELSDDLSPKFRILRGGFWMGEPGQANVNHRKFWEAEAPGTTIGFRCARDLP
jgi:sulfatase modifying factor 1